jgi:hypothetical protein
MCPVAIVTAQPSPLPTLRRGPHPPLHARRSSSLVPLLLLSWPTARCDAQSGRHCEGPGDAAGKL